MTRKVKDIEEELQSLAYQVTYLDIYTCWNCIQIDGIQESPNEDWKTTETKVRNILKNKMHLDDTKIEIERAHLIRTASNRGQQW